MCVIIYKPRNYKLDKEILLRAWKANPDGAGLAWRDSRYVYWRKGFMEFDEFYDFYLKVWNEELVLHFRLGTSGGRTKEMTHPFPITKNDIYRKVLFGESEEGVLFHNGVVYGLGNETESDTYELAKILAYVDKEYRVKVLELTNSKYILYTPTKVFIVGNFEMIDKCKYSNTHWRHNRYWY